MSAGQLALFTRKPGNPEPARPHSCGGCDSRWSGAGTCHCGACHLTFGGLQPFDIHRVGMKCADVAALALRGIGIVKPGVYGQLEGFVAPGASGDPGAGHRGKRVER